MIGSSIEALRRGNARDKALAKVLEGVLEARGGKDIPHARQASPTKTEPTQETQAPKKDLRQQTYDLLHLVREPSSSERQALLEKKGYVFLPVLPRSLAQVVAEDQNYFWSGELEYVNDRPELRDFVPPAMEVALNPTQLALPDSFYKSRPKQLEMIDEYSRAEIETEFLDARAIMLPATGYAQADKAYRAQKDQVLFRDYFARALDNTSGVSAASVGRGGPGDYRLDVDDCRAGSGYDHIGAVPAVVFLRK